MSDNNTVENTMEDKQGHATIYEALSAFQAELKSVPRTKDVSFNNVKFWYAPLDEIVNYLYPILGKHGLSFRHEINDKGVECILMHGTRKQEEVTDSETVSDVGRILRTNKTIVYGEIRSGAIKIRTDAKMQDVGSDITYARRYSLALVAGIVTDEDNDIREETKKNSEKFALSQAKEKLEGLSSVEDLESKIGFFEAEIAFIANKKAPKLGLSETNYKALIKIANEKIDELNSSKK